MTQEQNTQNSSALPVLLSVKDAEKLGFTRSAFYRFLHRAEIPTVTIGGRKYIYRDRFFEWLDGQTGHKKGSVIS